MVTNLASLGHCDNVKPRVPRHESFYNLPRVGVVHDDVLRIASSTSANGMVRPCSCPASK
jgi:hypothetical protein